MVTKTVNKPNTTKNEGESTRAWFNKAFNNTNSPPELGVQLASTPSNTAKQKKVKFDTSAFVFETPISKIEEWVRLKHEELDDPEIPWPDEREAYVLLCMINELKFCKTNNIETLLINAQESAIMQLFDKKTKAKPKVKK